MSESTKLRFDIQATKMALDRWVEEINQLKAKLDEYEAEKDKLTQKLDKLEKEYAEKFGE